MNNRIEQTPKIIQLRRGYDAMIEAFLFTCEAKYLSAKTLFCYQHRLEYLSNFARLVHKPIEDLSKDDLLEYFHSLAVNRSAKTLKRLSPATVNGRIRVFNIFYKFLIAEGIIDENPMSKVSYIKFYKKLTPVIRPEQLSLALRNFDIKCFAGYRDMCMALLAYDSCMRIDELLSLNRWDVHLKPYREIKVIGKGNKERIVSFCPKTATKLLIYMNKYRENIPGDLFFPAGSGKKLDATNIYRSFRRAADKCGFRMNPHWLRHSGATELYRKTKNLRLVQSILGHSDIQTTQIYLHTSSDDIIRTYEKISPAMDVDF